MYVHSITASSSKVTVQKHCLKRPENVQYSEMKSRFTLRYNTATFVKELQFPQR